MRVIYYIMWVRFVSSSRDWIYDIIFYIYYTDNVILCMLNLGISKKKKEIEMKN